MEIECAHCGMVSDKPNGAVNRARKIGAPIFCDRTCAGIARRKGKSVAQRKAEKSAYDARCREEKRDEILAAKREYHKRTYDPVKAAEHRQKRMPYHVEYCRRPEYREYKRKYDRKRRAVKNYGDFAECYLLVMDIRDECLSQQSDYEIRHSKGRVAMTQQRRKDYDRTHSKKPEIGSLGHAYAYQGRQNGSLTSR